jgi:uncharacterized protein
MPEYLSPGVYIEEQNVGARPIEGVGTAMAAFVGFAAAGPANKPVLVTNWSQYVEHFGSLEEGGRRNPYMPGAYLGHAIYGYFTNGGTRCYVTRILPNVKGGADDKNAHAQLPSKASKAVPSLTIGAKGMQTSDIAIEITPFTGPEASEGAFNLRVKLNDIEETYENLVADRKTPKGSNARPVIEAVAVSQLVTVLEVATTGTLAERMPDVGSYVIKVPAASQAPMVRSNDFMGDVTDRSGLEGLEVADDVTMICAPDLMAAYEKGMIDKDGVKAVQLAMIAHCERMQDRVAIIDPLPGLNAQQVKKWREIESNFDSKFAALYYPWVQVNGPDGKPMAVPPSGHIAGIWARSDAERGVHKAPANEIVRGSLNPVAQITKGEQDTLNPIGVNCIRTFTGMGVRVWGARTLSSDPAWRYINVRRLFNYVEKSIERGTQWVVFEPNDMNLWERVKRDIGAFLTGVWREGALFGATPAQAFFVKCDEELNPQDVRDRGQLIIEIGIAPVKPAEFVIFRFQQYAGGGA